MARTIFDFGGRKFLTMSKSEKIIFWGGLVFIINKISLLLLFKLTTDPPFGGDIFRWQSIAFDIVFLAVWVYVLIRIYKKASRKEQEKDE